MDLMTAAMGGLLEELLKSQDGNRSSLDDQRMRLLKINTNLMAYAQSINKFDLHLNA